MSDLRERFVERIRRDGAPLSAELAAAFATVPRETFVAGGFQRRDGTWARPGDRDFLDIVYRDDVLVTKVDNRVPVSSSSQPSLMAIMLTALDVRPGMSVLEIGTGTGYNAALLAVLGTTVTSVDVQADVADRARTALACAEIAGVEVIHGDGYLGVPGSDFDRAIVTVGVAGVSPRWLAQLDVDLHSSRPGPSHRAAGAHDGPGIVIVPVEHAGTHPVLAVRGSPDGPVTATVVCPSGFMSAAGPLTADHPYAHPAPATAGSLAAFIQVSGPRWTGPLDSLRYRDLWYAAGVWHRRATHAALPKRDQSSLALLDKSGAGGAAILPDGTVLAGGAEADRYAADATAILDSWEAAGRPPMQAWRITLALTGNPDAPIWVPAQWSLTSGDR
jgi:protein-L-isoaspartate(D-aspartate) O-methyltransferase